MQARRGPWLASALVALLVAALARGEASAEEAAPGPVCEAILAATALHPEITFGVVFQDLGTGARCEVNADREFRTASLYKMIVLAELHRQVEAGEVTLAEPLVIEPRHAEDDPPELRPTEEFELAVADAAARMITFSDNASALALRERLGFEAVDAAPAWLGLESTELGARFRTTPADQAHFYELLYRQEVVSPAASAHMLDLLLRQEIADLIPRGLEPGVTVAHKTGTLEDSLHDAGIVFAPGGTYVLIVMTEYGGYDLVPAIVAIQDVSRAAYAAYSVEAPPVLLPEFAYLLSDEPPLLVPSTQPVALEAEPLDLRAPAVALPLDVEAWWQRTEVAAALLALAGLLFLAITVRALRRHPAIRYGRRALIPEVAHAAASERAPAMRFGRKDDDHRSNEILPASRSVAEVGAQPVVPSKRLQRVAEHFAAQAELLSQMKAQFEDEMEPLHELLVRQSRGMRRLLANLEERLRPLNEYADGEEANLDALERRIEQGGADHVARSFAKYLSDQRERIVRTREQIDQQRMPFVRFGEDQRETVETALARFDQDIAALEQNLAEQRRVMMRMLDAMRSDTFTAVRDYLAARQEALDEMADGGSTDPLEIARASQELRRSLEALAAESEYVRTVLERAERTDRSLAEAMPAGPRPMRPAPEPVEERAEAEAGS